MITPSDPLAPFEQLLARGVPPRFDSLADATAQITGLADGQLIYVTSDKTYYGRSGGQWHVIWSSPASSNIPLATGFSGSCVATRIGGLVEIVVSASGAIPTGNTTIAPAGAVPAVLRPTGIRRGPSAMNGLAASDLYVDSTGLITVRNETGAARTGVTGNILYLLG